MQDAEPASDDAEKSRYFIQALSRGLAVLAAFRPRDRQLSTQQIAQRCQLPKSTVTRITHTLTQLGYLRAVGDAHGSYTLGIGALALGSTMLSGLDVRAVARAPMQALAAFSRAAVSLAVRDGLSMIYVEVCRSPAMVGLALDVGSHIPLARSAIGRAYLASASPAEHQTLQAQARLRGEPAYAQLCAGIERGCADYARHGCAISLGEWRQDTNGIAMAFRDTRSGTLMAVNCGGASSHLPSGFLLDDVRPRLAALVAALAA